MRKGESKTAVLVALCILFLVWHRKLNIQNVLEKQLGIHDVAHERGVGHGKGIAHDLSRGRPVEDLVAVLRRLVLENKWRPLRSDC